MHLCMRTPVHALFVPRFCSVKPPLCEEASGIKRRSSGAGMEKADSHPPELLDVEASVDMTCYLLSVFSATFKVTKYPYMAPRLRDSEVAHKGEVNEPLAAPLSSPAPGAWVLLKRTPLHQTLGCLQSAKGSPRKALCKACHACVQNSHPSSHLLVYPFVDILRAACTHGCR